MQVFGRQISKWWLLLVVPLVIACAPLLLILIVVAGHVGGGIVGPPAIWNRTTRIPSREELVGRYVESERKWDRAKTGPDAMLELRDDGTMTVSALPVDFITSTCVLSGSGTWSGPDEDEHITLAVTSNGTPSSRGACPGSGNFLEVAGRWKPYSLYTLLGDPDSGTGVWLERR